jgi:hypothetical protein
MRAHQSLFVASLIFFGASAALAQNAEDPPLQLDPYNKHHDRHLGHNHVYPDRGSVFRDAPKGSTTVNYAGLAYRFYNGVWFEPRGPAYIVVMPPIGLIVSALPAFATPFDSGGHSYLYANDVYYLPRPELGGYEVVNDPADDTQAAKASSASTAPGVAAAVVPAVAMGSAAAGASAVPASASVAPAVAPSATAKVTYDPKAPLGSPWNPMPDDPPAATARGYAQAASSVSPTPATTSPPPGVSTSVSQPSPAGFVGPTPAGTAGAVAAVPSVAATALPVSPAATVAAQPTPAAPPPSPPPASPSYSYATAPAAATPAVAMTTATTTAPSTQGYYSTASNSATGSSNGVRFTASPRNNQSPDQQARDQYDCYRFGVLQTGFDPMSSGAAAPGKPGQSDFDRARAACFEARGYSVR